MTLVEILIVIVIIGTMAAVGGMLLFPSDDARLQDEASRLAGTIKYVYNEAAIKNMYFRVSFNLDENSYRVESSVEPYFVGMAEEEEASPDPRHGGGSTGPGVGEEAAMASPPAFVSEDDRLMKPVKFAEGIKIKDITALHTEGSREHGQVNVYFLPNGWAEPAVINLSDDEEETFYSLEVNPLTGKATIRGEYLKATQESLGQGAEL
jgi:general secretion pathway protein H